MVFHFKSNQIIKQDSLERSATTFDYNHIDSLGMRISWETYTWQYTT